MTTNKTLRASIISALGFIVVFLINVPGFTVQMKFTVGVVFLTIMFWAFEAMPLPIASLIPLVFMSLSGIIAPVTMVGYYLQPIIFLLIGSFLLGSAVLRSGLAERIAYFLMTMSWVKGKTRRIGFAFMLSAAIITIFVSNTATVALFLPIIMSVAKLFSDNKDKIAQAEINSSKQRDGKSNVPGFLIFCVLLGAQSSGFAIMIGSTVSVAAIGVLQKLTGAGVNIYEWAKMGVPMTILVFLAFWVIVNFVYPPDVKEFPGYSELIEHRSNLGRMTKKEWITVLGLFVAIFLWLVVPCLKQLGFDNALILYLTKVAYLHVVPIYAAILFFLIPADAEKKPLLTWKDASADVNWGVILLIAGALSFSGMFSDQSVGLLGFLEGSLQALSSSSGLILVLASAILCVLLTSFISSTGFASMYLTVTIPIAAAIGLNVHAYTIMIGSLGNMDFILPSGGAPCATAFSAGVVTVPELFRTMLPCAIGGGIVIMLFSIPFII